MTRTKPQKKLTTERTETTEQSPEKVLTRHVGWGSSQGRTPFGPTPGAAFWVRRRGERRSPHLVFMRRLLKGEGDEV